MKQEDTNQHTMNIQWYPGHMTKTRRMIEEDVKLVDAVCEILDARIPIASRNPDIDAICGNKPRMIVLNRIDMADPALTKKWAEHFRAKGYADPASGRRKDLACSQRKNAQWLGCDVRASFSAAAAVLPGFCSVRNNPGQFLQMRRSDRAGALSCVEPRGRETARFPSSEVLWSVDFF